MDISNLPSLVRLKIFRMCGRLDLRSLALCSKWVRDEVAPILWKNAKVSWCSLEENTTMLRTSQHTTRNLRYIFRLKLHGDGNGELSIEEERRGFLSFGFGYFLQYCNPKEMRWLKIEDFMPADGLRLICEVFQNLYRLEISCVCANWVHLSHMPASVRYLSLQACDINKEHLDMLCTMENLEVLEIPWCHYVTYDDFVNVKNFKLKNLLQLDLRSTEASDSFIANVSKVCTKLSDLKLNGTPVTDLGMACIAHLSALKWLCMAGLNHITDIGVYFLSKLPALERLVLTFCEGLSPDCLSYIGTMKKLKSLLISGSCKGATDEEFAVIGNLTSLLALDIPRMNSLTNASLELISTLKNLEHLDVNHCKGFTDDGLVHLTKLPRLRALRMSHESNLTVEGLELHGLKDVLDKPPCGLD